MKTKIFLFLMVFIFCACASVNKEYQLPSQNLDDPVTSGKTRVIFFNTSNALFLDGSWRIGIKIDGVGVENLHLQKYVQLELEPGLHKLELSHVDIVTIRDSYLLNVRDKTMYVEVFNSITATKFKVLDEEPKDFRDQYQPAS